MCDRKCTVPVVASNGSTGRVNRELGFNHRIQL